MTVWTPQMVERETLAAYGDSRWPENTLLREWYEARRGGYDAYRRWVSKHLHGLPCFSISTHPHLFRSRR